MDVRERYDAILRIDNADTWDNEDMDKLVNWYEVNQDSDYHELIPELVFQRIICLHNRDCIKYDEPTLTISIDDLLSI